MIGMRVVCNTGAQYENNTSYRIPGQVCMVCTTFASGIDARDLSTHPEEQKMKALTDLSVYLRGTPGPISDVPLHGAIVPASKSPLERIGRFCVQAGKISVTICVAIAVFVVVIAAAASWRRLSAIRGIHLETCSKCMQMTIR